MANCIKSSNEDTRLFLLLILIYHCSFSQGKYKTASRKLSKRLCQCQTKTLKDLVPYTEDGHGLYRW
jgi:hypothetical protein